ncbi:MAG: GGDEF domain-containing protein, partial [Bacilli bacterium]|nr:GGDEF domain-containing protein [Bacilli bacterium]
MKNKKLVIIGIVLLVILLLGGYFIFTREDKNTTLNLMEKQWIENNKNTVMDIGVINNIPIFNYDGAGVFFDFLENLEKTTGLALNKVPFQYNDKIELVYAFNIVDKASENDVLIYRDNYVIVTNEKQKYIDLDEIKGLVIGVLSSDLEKANTYLKDGIDNVFKGYDDVETMFQDIVKPEVVTDESNIINPINAIIIPKTLYLDKILTNEDLNIAYHVTEMNNDYVITLGDKDKLNSILTKYYEKWSTENYENSYNSYLTDTYFDLKKQNEKDIVNFRSKHYVYGFVDNAPYDTVINKKLLGYNSEFLKQFTKLSNTEIKYDSFPNNNAMFDAFNANKIDIMLENHTSNKYNMDVYKTIPFYNNKLVVVSNISNNLVINSLNTLSNVELMTINNSEVSNYLSKNNLTTKTYNNISELVKNIKKNSVIAIDKEVYNFLANNKLKNYKVYYEESLPNDYGLVIRDIKENKIFANYLDFYLSFACNKKTINNSFYSLFNIDRKPIILKSLIIIVSTLIIIVSTILISKSFKKNKDSKSIKVVSKENKMKYIDQLTSLKNRTYLNDNLEAWDNSEIYPQSIVVVDLNNLSYINDNYGHIEGDKVIREAANILILNQVENSDIIRTSGNEFLIYMVGHDEKT